MGALIGSTLATDMTPDEAWAMLVSTDWAGMLAPGSPFHDKTFRRKEDARAFPSAIEFGLKNGFGLPTGFSPAQQASLLFDRVALPYNDVTRFADLPIPFACVAVDLQTSEAVVLDSGRLQEALRATMAIPGLFVPVRIGNRVLVDGGVLNNVPADVVRAMGADIVIAVDVGRDLEPRQTVGHVVQRPHRDAGRRDAGAAATGAHLGGSRHRTRSDTPDGRAFRTGHRVRRTGVRRRRGQPRVPDALRAGRTGLPRPPGRAHGTAPPRCGDTRVPHGRRGLRAHRRRSSGGNWRGISAALSTPTRWDATSPC